MAANMGGFSGGKDSGGIFAAVWIATDGSGSLLKDELKQLLKFLGATKLKGLMVDGSTGEFPVFTKEQRHEPLALAREAAPHLEIFYNASHPDFRTIIQLGQNAVNHHCKAIALLPPWFFPMPQEDLGEFFVRCSEGWKHQLPLLLYNFPEVVGKRIDLETISWVADRAPVFGIKQSGAEFEYHGALLELAAQKNFAVFTGADTRLAEAMDLGVIGCVSGLSNAIPEWVTGVYLATLNDDRATAIDYTQKIAAVERAIKPLPFALNVAATVEARGLAAGEPKYIRSSRTLDTYRQVVQELKQLFSQAGLHT